MRSIKKYAPVLALFVGLACPAYAQVCKEPSSKSSSGGKANLTCDMEYRNTVVTCDPRSAKNKVVGTNPACPPFPMPMINTPKRSYIADYSPYLFTFPRDASDRSRPYAGAYSLGTAGDATKTYQMFGNTAPGTRRMSACTTQLKMDDDPDSPQEEAVFVRLQMDNCANQYILNDALFPYQKEAKDDTDKVSGMPYSNEDPMNPLKRIDLESHCQPLKAFDDKDDEYDAGEYLQVAWKKMLQDPGYRKTTTGSKGIPCNYTKAFSAALSSTAGDKYGLTFPCDREPHLPEGISIPDKPVDLRLKPPNELKNPPEKFPEVRLSSISAIKYEQIVDPTHPFSPRWDFLITDREYSKQSAAMASVPTAGVIYLGLKEYLKTPDGAVYCAGLKKADKESDDKKKAEKLVPVDVLEFRRHKFEGALKSRVLYNNVCKQHQAQFTSGNDAWFIVMLLSYCNAITGFSFVYPWIYGKDFDCWKCFGLESGQKADDEDKDKLPPCTVNYLGKDQKMKFGQEIHFPGAFNLFNPKAQCDMFGGPSDNMGKVCEDLRKPYTQLNKLKMRYHNTDKDDSSGGSSSSSKNEDDNVLVEGYGTSKNGALEGLTFKEYFGNHMPYPRLWDTGNSLQKTPNATLYQPPLDTTGQYTTIVGIGREAAAKSAADNANDVDGKKVSELYTDQRCKAMGWRSPLWGIAGSSVESNGISGTDAAGLFYVSTGNGSVKIYVPDPVTSWTELKMYQARTLRNSGLSCLARYEKVFKPGSAENMALLTSGAEWSQTIISKCAREKNGRTGECTYQTLAEYVKEGKKENDDKTIYLKQFESSLWPNGWRGYMAAGGLDITDKTKFPRFGGTGEASIGIASTGGYIYDLGLSNAQTGDIVLLPFGVKMPSKLSDLTNPGLAKVAVVIETNLPGNTDCETRKNCYVKVLEPDNGKFPDICGTTDTWGEMKTRYYYMPGKSGEPSHLPPEAKAEYERIKSTSDCEETRISHCEASDWSKLILYRIRNDIRKGCDKDTAAECGKDNK